jgi:predicted DNA-binding protein with PD1-like motif
MFDTQIETPVAFLGGAGLVCTDNENRLDAHFHGVLENLDRAVHGGHLVAGESPVYNTVDFLLTELLGVQLVRRWDEETATVEMVVEST